MSASSLDDLDDLDDLDIDDLVELRESTTNVIADLSDLRHDDPDAAVALHAIRLTKLTLECFWLPAIDAELERARCTKPAEA